MSSSTNSMSAHTSPDLVQNKSHFSHSEPEDFSKILADFFRQIELMKTKIDVKMRQQSHQKSSYHKYTSSRSPRKPVQKSTKKSKTSPAKSNIPDKI